MKKLLVCLIVAGGVMGLAAYAQGFFDPVDRDPHGKVLIEVAGQYPHEDYVLQVTIGLRMYDTHSGTVVVSGQVFDNASLPVKAAYEQWITDSLVVRGATFDGKDLRTAILKSIKDLFRKLL